MRLNWLCCLLCLVATFARAEIYDQQQTEQDASDTLTKNQELQLQKDQLLGLLAQVDERYGDVAASLKAIQERITIGDKNLDKIRKEIKQNQEQIDKLTGELSGQIKAAYAMGQQGSLKLMMNQQDPVISSRIMLYYDYINKNRLEKLANFRQTVNYLDQLDKDKQSETALLEQDLAQKKSDQAALEEVRKQRNKLIAKLNDNFSSEEDQLTLLKDSEDKLISLIEKLEHEEGDGSTVTSDRTRFDNGANFPKLSGEFSSLKGKLPLPVKGKLASMFNNTNSESHWKGVLINTQEGAEIRAVNKGKVVYADNLKSYGLLIIIEHGKDYMTLYGFNQSLYKKKDDWVEAGDVIASVGQSGGRTKPGLYFEIRKNGKAVDPLVWCRN